MHPKAVLLVNHRKPEIAELDRLLEQRMRADEGVDVAFLQGFQDRFAFPATLPACEQRHA